MSSSTSTSKKSKTSYKDAITALTEVLTEREKELDERDAQLRKDRDQFELEKTAVYGEVNPSDVIHLNVGGTKVVTLRRTLTSVPGSMLASKFSGRWDDSTERDENGHFFVDQNYALFGPMLEYLRNKANGDEKYPVQLPKNFGDGFGINDFYRMIDYYGMTDGLYPTSLNVISQSMEGEVIIDSRKVTSSEWVTVQLLPNGHGRSVSSFVVTLGDVQRIQIGWKYKADIQNNFNHLGVGETENSSALDLTRSLFLLNGSTTTIGSLSNSNGTTVRCENYGLSWYVNGEHVDLDGKSGRFGRTDYMYPTVSIKGEMEITSVDFFN